MAFSRNCERDVWILAKGHKLLLALIHVPQRQSFPPGGVSHRYNPPPSLSRYGLSFALAFFTSISVNAICQNSPLGKIPPRPD
jgi:hypothetical protein